MTVIINDTDPQFSIESGTYTTSFACAICYGLTMAYATATTYTHVASWQPDSGQLLPIEYDVYAYIPLFHSTTTLAHYEIRHDGKTRSAGISQAAITALDERYHWAYLGRYPFDGSGLEYVTVRGENIPGDDLDDPPNPEVAADAIAFIPVDRPPDVVVAINNGNEDAGNNGFMQNCSYEMDWNEVYLGHCADDSPIYSGFHFQDVDVPAGATIQAAFISFTVDGPYTNSIQVQFRGQRVANSVPFTNTVPITQLLPLSSAIVNWQIPAAEEWTLGQIRYSADIKNIIQELVNLTNWQSGNDLSILVNGKAGVPINGHRRVIACERDCAEAAKLLIWYEVIPP